MKLGHILLASALFMGAANASEFVNYKHLTKKLKAEAKKNGQIATVADVKHALKAKDWAVVDIRTQLEWAGASIKGSYRIGRQSPEKALESIVLDDEDNFIKDKIVVVCNSKSRASIASQTFRQMGFKEVKIHGIYTWIDKCNPVVTGYSKKKDKKGTKQKFGMFKASHCSK